MSIELLLSWVVVVVVDGEGLAWFFDDVHSQSDVIKLASNGRVALKNQPVKMSNKSKQILHEKVINKC